MDTLWIPAERFIAVTDRYGQPPYVGKQSTVGRRLNELRSGRQKFISLETADAMLIELGLEQFWHVLPQDGGLADIYEDGKQYGSPHESHTRPPEKLRREIRLLRKQVSRLTASRDHWREEAKIWKRGALQ